MEHLRIPEHHIHLIYIRILQKYSRGIGLFYSNNVYLPRALKTLMTNLHFFLYLAFMTTYVDIYEGEIDIGSVVLASFLFARLT